MKCFVYILNCNDNSYYTGITWNLKKRISEHNNHMNSGLQNIKLPVKLVYWEAKESRIIAAKREKEIKGWTRVKRELLIESLH